MIGRQVASSKKIHSLKTLFSIAIISATAISFSHSVAEAEINQINQSSEIGVTLVDSNGLSRNRISSGWWREIFLPMCASVTESDCIDSLSIYTEGSSPKAATFIEQAPGATYNAQPDIHLPRSGEAQLFSSDAGGTKTKYSLKVIEKLYYSDANRNYGHTEFSIFLMPYIEDFQSSYSAGTEYDYLRLAWQGNGVAGKPIDFKDGIRARVKVRLPIGAGGWFSGRVRDPLVSLKTAGDSELLEIDALPARVPKVQGWIPADQATPLMKKLKMSAGGNHGIEAGFDDSVEWINQLRPFVSDKATSEETIWVIRSTFVRNNCFPDQRISGFVTTNAMAYSWNPPKFRDGFLDYQVAGMHYNADGSLSSGSYDLVLSSETARCLYQFTSAPISASISVLGENSESRTVETSVVSERDGFLKLSVNGFGFSAPTIRVQLRQERVATSKAALSSSTPKQTKKSIKCLKGKTYKTVSAVSPRCPTGYKKVG